MEKENKEHIAVYNCDLSKIGPIVCANCHRVILSGLFQKETFHIHQEPIQPLYSVVETVVFGGGGSEFSLLSNIINLNYNR